MIRTATLAASLCLVILFVLPSAARGQNVIINGGNGWMQVAQGGQAAPADGAKGAIADAKTELAAILKLAAPAGKLVLDRDGWKSGDSNDAEDDGDPAAVGVAGGIAVRARFGGLAMLGRVNPDFAKLMEKFQAKTGAHMGSSSMSNNNARGTFSSQSIEGSFTISENSFDFQVRETAGGGRSVRFHAEDDALSLQVIDATGDLVLILSQDANGAVRLLHVSGDQVTRAKADSYMALCREKRDYIEKQFVPTLENAGVGLPLTSWSPAVRSAVLELLKSDPAKTPELIAQLDSDLAATRDAATKALAASFLVCYKDLKAALDNPKSSAEVKARIQEIFKANTSKLEPAAVIESMGLLRDPELLSDMLQNAKTDEDRKALTAALEKARSTPASKPTK